MPSRMLDFTPIYTKFQEIEITKNISEVDVPLLRERLVIAFTTLEGKQQRRVKSLKNNEYLILSRQRKARKVYLEVLQMDPHIFVAFTITMSPKMCSQFDRSPSDRLRFYQQHKGRTIILNNDANMLFWQIAIDHGIANTPSFCHLMRSIFKLAPPATGAEMDGSGTHSLILCDLAAIRVSFGNTICDAIECSPTHASKRMEGRFSETTQCLQTYVPYDGYQDTIIRLDVGSALALADNLFPLASQKIASILPKSQDTISFSEIGILSLIISGNRTLIYAWQDSAYFTLRGASVSAVSTIFTAEIFEGIENSELRVWERDQLLVDTTDCISMQIWRAQPQHGIIRLRIGFFAGVNLANKLYYDEVPFAITKTQDHQVNASSLVFPPIANTPI